MKPSSLVTDKLTGRETEVVILLSRGLTNEEIAAKLFLTEGTVRNYVASIVNKLGVADRTQAAIIGVQHGLDNAR